MTYSRFIVIACFFAFLPFCLFGQKAICDSASIYSIYSQQLKMADKSFGGTYIVMRQFLRFTNDSIYVIDPCTDVKEWRVVKGYSANASIGDTAKNSDNICSISKPMFNKGMTLCKVKMYIHQGEWGGNTTYYFYKKKKTGWRLVKEVTVSVSW